MVFWRWSVPSEQRLHQQIKVEQERWMEINHLLEELERSAAQQAQ